MYEFLMDNGMTPARSTISSCTTGLKQHCILGNDYYWTNEHRVFADGRLRRGRRGVRLHRDHAPILRTLRAAGDAHRNQHREGPVGDEAVQWLWKQWANVLRLRNVGIPTVGFTWYSLTDQIDWDTALREQNGHVNPLGLFDLDRNIRNVGRAYKKLIATGARFFPPRATEADSIAAGRC
jgi:beta-glucosidase